MSKFWLISTRRSSVSVATRLLQNSEDVDEEIDDVQVQFDGGHDVFLGGHFVHDHLSVVDDEQSEHSHASETHHQFGSARVEDQLKHLHHRCYFSAAREYLVHEKCDARCGKFCQNYALKTQNM